MKMILVTDEQHRELVELVRGAALEMEADELLRAAPATKGLVELADTVERAKETQHCDAFGWPR